MDRFDETTRLHFACALLTSLIDCEKCPFEKTCFAKKIEEEKDFVSCSAMIQVMASKKGIIKIIQNAGDKKEVRERLFEYVNQSQEGGGEK